MTAPDLVVVGSGPNGLAAAVTAAEAGLSVEVIEGADTFGGGCRTEALTLPGFRHDVCSAVHPLLLASPFFSRPGFDRVRAALLFPDVPFAHPLDGGAGVAAFRSVGETASSLGMDGPAYRRLLEPLVDGAPGIVRQTLAPLRSFPAHPLELARFGLPGLLPVDRLVHRFAGAPARALIAGVAAHSMAPLDAPLTSAFGLLLTMTAHAVGWPVVEGGSAAIVEAMVDELVALGGTMTTGRWVGSLAELPPSSAVILDLTPAAVKEIAGAALPPRYRRALDRFRYGPGVCKVDWALSGPVPWTSETCRRAGTVHLGGTFEEVAASEADVTAGRHPDRPYCIIVQPGVVDRTRAPAGQHALWGYCHVPSGSDRDVTGAIEAQVERFAPGFTDLVVARSAMTAIDLERHNPNYVGGDIGGGMASIRQTLFRPTIRWNPYRTPIDGVYLCSASTPPGPGVHGMCGVFAARTLLHDRFGGPSPLRATA